MDHAEFAAAQIATVSQQARELLDLVSITLFTEGLAGAEATLAELRVGQIDFTMGVLADVAQNAPAARLDVTLILPDSSVAHLTLVIPVPLLERLAESASGPAPAADEGGARPPLAALGFDGPDDVGASGNVSPLRPAPAEGGVPVNPVAFPPLPAMQTIGQGQPHPIDLILDVSMRVTVELGRSSMTVEEVLALGPGSVVELNKLAGEPVDILVNERLIARGEGVVVEDHHLPVAALEQVDLDDVRAGGKTGLGGHQCVLGKRRGVATVGDVERQARRGARTQDDAGSDEPCHHARDSAPGSPAHLPPPRASESHGRVAAGKPRRGRARETAGGLSRCFPAVTQGRGERPQAPKASVAAGGPGSARAGPRNQPSSTEAATSSSR